MKIETVLLSVRMKLAKMHVMGSEAKMMGEVLDTLDMIIEAGAQMEGEEAHDDHNE